MVVSSASYLIMFLWPKSIPIVNLVCTVHYLPLERFIIIIIIIASCHHPYYSQKESVKSKNWLDTLRRHCPDPLIRGAQWSRIIWKHLCVGKKKLLNLSTLLLTNAFVFNSLSTYVYVSRKSRKGGEDFPERNTRKDWRSMDREIGLMSEKNCSKFIENGIKRYY